MRDAEDRHLSGDGRGAGPGTGAEPGTRRALGGGPAGLRILYLHQHFSTPNGTTATRAWHHAGALAAAGHAVTLACGRYDGAATGLDGPFRRGRRQGRIAGFEVVEFDIRCGNSQGLLARTGAFLRFAAGASRLALGTAWDMIIASSTPLTVVIPALLAHRLRGTPFIFEIRDPWPELPEALSRRSGQLPLPGREAPPRGGVVPRPVLRLMGLLADAACRHAAAVVALTEGMARVALERGTEPDRLRVLPQGADLVLFHPGIAPWRPPGISVQESMAVYAGAHGRANGLHQLLDAAARLRRTGLHLVLVGEGAEKPALMARAAAEQLPVTFLEPMPKAHLARLLAAAEIGLLCLAPVPEFAEWTAPNKLAEGLASGLPMVTNVPGRAARLLAEGGCGLAVPAGDADALAAALLALATDPPRRQAMARAARIVAERQFDQRRIAARLVAVVEAVAGHAPRRATPRRDRAQAG
ncbi:glycosyltransferase family 4 protein [Roseomonas frigidaquae]|uniref:Glycosyltransferase family 4 protein n=1 Tax=Falsiroseomonas frigidaquae TaxID=487318 RepID=A0ABX1EX76_9PROT|nr:glycosyltransferase family 4 protein [Falsiroseomonas frigidaquae]NKE44680.1 glycosyltransferase family 4 protein [Falsiroseomonas frigidaquae]